jgi:predicted transcriptional regulator
LFCVSASKFRFLPPIIDQQNKVVGYISNHEIIHYLSSQDFRIINADFSFVVPEDEKIETFADGLCKHKIMSVAKKHVPIIEYDTPLGTVCKIFYEHKLVHKLVRKLQESIIKIAGKSS